MSPKEEHLVRNPAVKFLVLPLLHWGPVKVLRAMSVVQQVEWPQNISPDMVYCGCKKEASEPVLCPRLLIRLQQHESPTSCVSTKLSVLGRDIPPRRLHSAASSISPRFEVSRTHTCVGMQVVPQHPVPCLKMMACRFRGRACRFLSSISAMGIEELFRSLARRSERLSKQVEDMSSPSPTVSFFKVWSVIFSQPDKSRCSRERHAPREDQLEEEREEERTDEHTST